MNFFYHFYAKLVLSTGTNCAKTTKFDKKYFHIIHLRSGIKTENIFFFGLNTGSYIRGFPVGGSMSLTRIKKNYDMKVYILGNSE